MVPSSLIYQVGCIDDGAEMRTAEASRSGEQQFTLCYNRGFGKSCFPAFLQALPGTPQLFAPYSRCNG
jgi:hypothetical protein